MGRPVTHGTVSRYKAGCRCPECSQAKANKMRVYREAPIAGPGGSCEAPPGVGRNEAAVMAELAGISAVELHPGLASAALELARVLDHPRAISSKPAAARNLADLLDRLRKGAGQKRTRLSSVRNMSREAASA